MEKKLLLVILFASIMFVSAASFATTAWWKLCPPIITSPTPNQYFDPNQSVTYCWALSPCVYADSVAGYETQFANAPPFTVNVYNPSPSGGTCQWDAIRYMTSKCWTTNHQTLLEPTYWRVRTVLKDGTRSYWAVSYHRVGDNPNQRMPLTITSPPIINGYHVSSPIHHAWSADAQASSYEVAFANSPEYSIAVFDNCQYDLARTVSSNYYDCSHDMSHLPIYFLVRAVYPDNSRGNWAISYYFVDYGDKCVIGTEDATWGNIKNLFK